MKPEDFQPQSPGRVVRSVQGYWTFVPDPLPPNVSFDIELIRLLSDADRVLGELAGVARLIPNPLLLVRPFLRREAVLSSRIEGTVTGLGQLLLFEEAQQEEAPDVREVANYVAALEYGLLSIRDRPVSLRLIRELHEILMRDGRGGDRNPGRFRTEQVAIGYQGQPIAEARYIPPSPLDLPATLDSFERSLRDPGDLPFLIWLAVVHYQFEAIHPFTDGNGRIGRLLIPLLLAERGALSQPLLYLSEYFERNRDSYLDLLYRISTQGDWRSWIAFFLRAVAVQGRDAIDRADRLLKLWYDLRQRVAPVSSSARLIRIVDDLIAYPFVTANGVSSRLQVTFAAAQHLIQRLVEADVLTEITGRQRNRVYASLDILEILDPERSPPS